MPTEAPIFDLKACSCQNLRRVARSVSHLYDNVLSVVGIRITQFYILQLASERPEMMISDLAAKLELDRSTTSKNLRPLIRSGLITIESSTVDRRSKVVKVSDTGRAVAGQALVLWKEAQDRIQAINGKRSTMELRERLRALKVE